MSMHGPAPDAPAELATVEDVSIWPWTGRDLAGTTADPINLIFKGDVGGDVPTTARAPEVTVRVTPLRKPLWRMGSHRLIQPIRAGEIGGAALVCGWIDARPPPFGYVG
jgi:hypothetical protein